MNFVEIYLQNFLAFSTLLIISDSQSYQVVSDECLDCICMNGCEISHDYWVEGGEQIIYRDETAEPFITYMHCKDDWDCTKRTIRYYMSQYQQDCNNDGYIDCYDYGVLHSLGPLSCSSGQISQEILDKVDNCFQDNTESPMIVSSDCLHCICMTDGCGISLGYWIDGGELRIHEDAMIEPQMAYSNCLSNVICTSTTIENYMNRYKVDCNNDGLLDCNDYSVIHKFGPFHCETKPDPQIYKPYQNYISSCLHNQSLSTKNGADSITSSFGSLWLLLVLFVVLNKSQQSIYILAFTMQRTGAVSLSKYSVIDI